MHTTQQTAAKSESVARQDERTSTIIFAAIPRYKFLNLVSSKYPKFCHCCLAALCQPSWVLSFASALDVLLWEKGRQVRDIRQVARPFSSSRQSLVY
jgi:hypothetical protein